jgi:hypothetical protein
MVGKKFWPIFLDGQEFFSYLMGILSFGGVEVGVQKSGSAALAPVAVTVGRNVAMRLDGDILTLSINVRAPGVRSKKGEGPNMVIASTGGNVQVPGLGGAKLGLNLYVPA